MLGVVLKIFSLVFVYVVPLIDNELTPILSNDTFKLESAIKEKLRVLQILRNQKPTLTLKA